MASIENLVPDCPPIDTTDSIAWFVTKPERGWPLLPGIMMSAIMAVNWFSDDRRSDLPIFYTGGAIALVLVVWGLLDLFWQPDRRDQALVRFAQSSEGHELLIRGDTLEDRLCRHTDAVNCYRDLRRYLGSQSPVVVALRDELLRQKDLLVAEAREIGQAQIALKTSFGWVELKTR